MQLTGGEAVIRSFQAAGGRFAFGIASGKLTPVMAALSRANAPRFIGVRHEGSASLMAAGSMAGTGQIALALGELGPGGGNLVSGVASAFSNNLPLLALTSGNVLAASRPTRGQLMDIDLESLFRPITRFSETAIDGRRIPELIRTAVRAAHGPRPGPVHLNIPADILAGLHPYAPEAFDPVYWQQPSPAAPDPRAIAQAVALLVRAERPLIIGGGGAIMAGVTDGLVRLADRLDAAVTATQMGIGLVPSAHPRFIGQGGTIGGPAVIEALEQADVVLALGCRFSSWFWRGGRAIMAPEAQLVQVDTDPNTIGRIRAAEIGIQADAALTIDALLDALPPRSSGEPGAWPSGLRRRWEAHRESIALTANLPTTPAHPGLLTARTAALLPDDALVVYDGGHTTFWNNDLPVRAPRERFHEPGLGQLGFGLAYALALKAAYPDRLVLNTTGDGSFGFTVQELDTARRENLPVISLIHNNEAWGVIREGQAVQGFDFATSLSGTDYAAIARGFGCFGARVEHPDDLPAAFAAAVASGLPAVLDCRVAFVAHPTMSSFVASGKPAAPTAPLPW